MKQAERLALLAVLVALAGVHIERMQGAIWVESLDRPAFDMLLEEGLGERPAPDDVTVVVVDDESITRLGEQSWPISRAHWADFLERLATFSPAAVGIDAWFESPAPKLDVELARDVVDRLAEAGFEEEEEGVQMVDWLEGLATKKDGDRRMAKALAELGNVVLGAACLPAADSDVAAGDRTAHLKFLDVPVAAARRMPCARLATSIPQLTMSAHGQAGLTVGVDKDGVSRRYPYVFRFGERALPSLALAVASRGRPDQAKDLLARALDHDQGVPLLAMRPISEIRRVRLSDVIEASEGSRKALEGAFKDKMVLVGVSARGAEDYMNSALESDIPGVFLHAAATDALLNGPLLRSTGKPAQVALGASLALLLLLIGLVRARERASVVLFAAAAAGTLWVGGAVWALRHQAWVLPVVPVLLAIAAWATVRVTFQYVRAGEDRKRARTIRTAFCHYLAPAVVETLIEDPRRLSLGGERRQITAFFSDVKGFTSISESLDPSDLVRLLNEVLGSMSEIIIDEGGTIDKYIGDAIVAMWGAPMDQRDHAARACRAALRCEARLEELRPGWVERGYPEVRVRIGLNSGTAVVGNMGSDQRYDYTMMGDTVNLAARLEGANNQYGTWIMAGPKTVQLSETGPEPVLFRELDSLRVKGKKLPIRVYDVVAMKEEASEAHRELVNGFHRGLVAYRELRWEDAAGEFGALAEAGDDASAIFAKRVATFEETPPPEDWDGVFVMTSKS